MVSEEVDVLTCGSLLKLVNTDYGVRLHSHNVGYGSGSGQQSVTGLTDTTDAGSYWQVNDHDRLCFLIKHIEFHGFNFR